MAMDMCVQQERERERTEKKVVLLGVGPSDKFLTVN